MGKIKWKHEKSMCPTYIYDGLEYYISQDISFDWLWAIWSVPNIKTRVYRFATYKEMYVALLALANHIDSGDSKDYKFEIEWITQRVYGTNVRSYVFADSNDVVHYYAVDMQEKKFWEYFEPKRESPYCVGEEEALAWADDNLPQYEQLSLPFGKENL